jgi:hypothetical protein
VQFGVSCPNRGAPSTIAKRHHMLAIGAILSLLGDIYRKADASSDAIGGDSTDAEEMLDKSAGLSWPITGSLGFVDSRPDGCKGFGLEATRA